MPFIVSLYKYVILLFCFLVLVGTALGLFALLDPNGPIPVEGKAAAIGLTMAFLVFFVLGLGGSAILISIHDRHREIAEGIDRLATLMEASPKRPPARLR